MCTVELNGQSALDVACRIKVNDLTDILARYRQHLIHYVIIEGRNAMANKAISYFALVKFIATSVLVFYLYTSFLT
jgi:hypothetical protein